MKFTIKEEIVKPKVYEVDVELVEQDGEICLMVDGYYVFTLMPNGKGYLEEAVDENIGLQLDKEGAIVLEE